MSHNVSPRQLLSRIRAAPIACWPDSYLEVECGSSGCPIGRAYPIARLAAEHPGATVMQVIRRMRCAGCGKMPHSVVLIDTVERGGRRVGIWGAGVRD